MTSRSQWRDRSLDLWAHGVYRSRGLSMLTHPKWRAIHDNYYLHYRLAESSFTRRSVRRQLQCPQNTPMIRRPLLSRSKSTQRSSLHDNPFR
ncbi:hypothetical protein SCLCIDRAFT_1219656 [Scleroderma citrinum Foug A]|uniref:Uncharacterized protein n=1 Tax=Scleroderma citrinum Foug A TaxID=1036808 RepID=A0A0C3D904_9AGAM|nr:hypothetical protein SCLCIDRAFT_1219656 [Scleroderma citrinum Foug A]